MHRPMLEIAANSLVSAMAAQAGGADRIELCSALEVGGLTPSHATIALARQRLDIPIHVLIRPRAGGFVYNDRECDLMCADIQISKSLGCAGVAIGVLDAGGDVDVPRCRKLLEAACGMSVTFHRAFDFTRDPFAALETSVVLGCERVLTSGQADSAPAGAALIRQLVAAANGRITILPGAGIHAGNIAQLAKTTGAWEFHTSAKVRIAGPAPMGLPQPAGLETSYWQTDTASVRACVAALRTAASA